jgi:hypothetical protein
MAAGLGAAVGLVLLLIDVAMRPEVGTRKSTVSAQETSHHIDVDDPAVRSPRPSASTFRARKPATAELPSATAPVRFERAADEWQGMLPEPGEVWPCPENASVCGMGRACVDRRCTPCVEDQECLGNELCVLGVCVLTDLAGCRSKEDCADAEVCMMSGFTPLDGRNNSDLQSKCVLDDWDEDRDDTDNDVAQHAENEADLIQQNSSMETPGDTDGTPDHRGPAIDALRDVLRLQRATP